MKHVLIGINFFMLLAYNSIFAEAVLDSLKVLRRSLEKFPIVIDIETKFQNTAITKVPTFVRQSAITGGLTDYAPAIQQICTLLSQLNNQKISFEYFSSDAWAKQQGFFSFLGLGATLTDSRPDLAILTVPIETKDSGLSPIEILKSVRANHPAYNNFTAKNTIVLTLQDSTIKPKFQNRRLPISSADLNTLESLFDTNILGSYQIPYQSTTKAQGISEKSLEDNKADNSTLTRIQDDIFAKKP